RMRSIYRVQPPSRSGPTANLAGDLHICQASGRKTVSTAKSYPGYAAAGPRSGKYLTQMSKPALFVPWCSGYCHENAICCLAVVVHSMLRDGAAAVDFADRSDTAGGDASDRRVGDDFDFAADFVRDVDVSTRGTAAR